MAKSKTFADFVTETDPIEQARTKVAAVLARMGDTWEYSREIADQAHISVGKLAVVRGSFADRVVAVRDLKQSRTRYVWCGTPKLAAQIRTRAGIK